MFLILWDWLRFAGSHLQGGLINCGWVLGLLVDWLCFGIKYVFTYEFMVCVFLIGVLVFMFGLYACVVLEIWFGVVLECIWFMVWGVCLITCLVA